MRYEVLQVVISEANIAVSGARLPVDIMSTKWLVLNYGKVVPCICIKLDMMHQGTFVIGYQ